MASTLAPGKIPSPPLIPEATRVPKWRRAWASRLADRRALLWAFLGLHLAYIVVLLPIIVAGRAEGDLPLYRDWAEHALQGGQWPGIDIPWVYPVGALVPVVLPDILGPFCYQLVWLLLLTAANGAALWVLTGGGRRQEAFPAAWYWLLTVFLLSPVSLLRLEGVTGPLVIIAFAVMVTWPALTGVFLGLATWVKVWPAAVIFSAILATRKWKAVIIGGLIATAITAGAVVFAGGGKYLLSFLTVQTDRSLQIEAPLATPWLWAAILGIRGAAIYQNHLLATREVAGPGDYYAVAASTPLLIGAASLIGVLLITARRRLKRLSATTDVSAAEHNLVILGGFAFASALIVFNKVGSPQYMLWLAPIVVAGLAAAPHFWRRVSWVMAAVSLLTTLVFPVLYLPLIDHDPFAAAVLGARNILLMGLFVWSVLALARFSDPRQLDGRTTPITAFLKAIPAKFSSAVH